jgi:hypothetical protein
MTPATLTPQRSAETLAPPAAQLLLGRGSAPTATALAHRLGWLEQEAALDGTPLQAVRVPFAPPPDQTAAPRLLPLHEGPALPALSARAHDQRTRLLGLAVVDAPHALGSTPAPLVALTADEALLRERPRHVVGLLAVLLRAGAWAREHPTEATALLAADAGVSTTQLVAAHGPALAQTLLLGLDEHRELVPLRARHAHLRGEGLLEHDVDLRAWVDPRPLGAAVELLAAERTAWI